jgi:hypothetical protein
MNRLLKRLYTFLQYFVPKRSSPIQQIKTPRPTSPVDNVPEDNLDPRDRDLEEAFRLQAERMRREGWTPYGSESYLIAPAGLQRFTLDPFFHSGDRTEVVMSDERIQGGWRFASPRGAIPHFILPNAIPQALC